MLEQRIYDVLKGRRYVSVPWLQLELELDYKSAHKLVDDLREMDLLSAVAQGVEFELNTESLCARTLSREECMDMGLRLSAAELELLKKIKRRPIPSANTVDIMDAELKKLYSMKLAHEFDSRVFSSVMSESINGLAEWVNSEKTDDVIIGIAIPILKNSIRLGKDATEILSSPFLPQRANRFIRLGLEKYKRMGELPAQCSGNLEIAGPESKLAYEIIEAFVAEKHYMTKQSYIKNAKKHAEHINESELCSDMYKRAAQKAYENIRDEFSYSNMMELRRIILEKRIYD